MKKYTKLIALVLSVILGVSACCFNSFALNDKTVYDMGNGLTLTAGYGKPFLLHAPIRKRRLAVFWSETAPKRQAFWSKISDYLLISTPST